MLSSKLFILAILLTATASVSSAYTTSKVDSLLANYSVPSAIVSSLSPVNLTLGTEHYVALYSSNTLYFLVNVTANSYTLVLNSTHIAAIIKNYTINSTINKVNFSTLESEMKSYEASSASALSDCYYRTGGTSGLSCNVTNYCASCQTVPLCGQYFNNASVNIGGPEDYGTGLGVFGSAVEQFGTEYLWLNKSFGQFINASSSVNRANVGQNIAALSESYLNISNLSESIGNSSLFLYSGPLNIYSICPNYANPATAPWYCNSLGYCQNLNYNYTLLGNMGSQLDNVQAYPLSDPRILQIAQNTTALEESYVYPVLSKAKQSQLKLILNTTIPGYSVLVNNTKALLKHISNATLKDELLALTQEYANVTTDYFTANLSSANRTLASQYSELSSEYSTLNTSYSQVLGLAENNTVTIIELQLSGPTSSSLSNLAFDQLQLNSLATANNISNISIVNTQLKTVASKLSAYPKSTVTLTNVARGVDAPFVRALASVLGTGYTSSVSLAPLLGTAVPLIVGILVLVLFMFFRSYLRMHHKLSANPRIAKNWRFIYLVIGLVVLVWMAVNYMLLVSASGSAQFGVFQGALSASKTVVVAVNGTPTAGESTCANKIAAQVTALGKQPVSASFDNSVCQAGGTTGTVSSCMNAYASKNTPVILLTNNASASFSLYSLYGTVLSVGGNNTVMNSCYVSLMLR